MKEYTYVGKIEVELMGFGIVKPSETIVTDKEINHPLFVVVEKKKKKQK